LYVCVQTGRSSPDCTYVCRLVAVHRIVRMCADWSQFTGLYVCVQTGRSSPDFL